MDDILKIIVDEVALEENQGCTLDRLWKLLDDQWESKLRNARVDRMDVGPEPLENAEVGRLDEYLKEYLWPFIVSLKDLHFQLATGDSTSAPNTPTSSKKRKLGKGIVKEIPTVPLSKSELRGTALSTVKEQYGDRLRVAASEEVREAAILSLGDRTLKLSDTVMQILSKIALARGDGTTQVELSKVLDIDPRSVYHYIKTLAVNKLIVKFPLTIKSASTNLCIHKRFAHLNVSFLEYRKNVEKPLDDTSDLLPLSLSEEDIDAHKHDDKSDLQLGKAAVSYHNELVKQRLTQLLKNAKGEIMVVSDLMDALKIQAYQNVPQRKFFNRIVESLSKASHIQRVNVVKKSQDGKPTGHDRCVRLLKLYFPNRGVNIGVNGPLAHKSDYLSKKEESDPDSNLVMGEGGRLSDLPLEYQIYRLIALAGDRGVVAATLRRSLNNLGHRLLTKLLARVTKPPEAAFNAIGAGRTAEFVGRERRYRYYSSEAYNRYRVDSEHGPELLELNHMLSISRAECSSRPLCPPTLHHDGEPAARPKPPRKKRKTVATPVASGSESEAEESEESATNIAETDEEDEPTPDITRDSDISSEEDINIVCRICNIDDPETDKWVLLCDSCDDARRVWPVGKLQENRRTLKVMQSELSQHQIQPPAVYRVSEIELVAVHLLCRSLIPVGPEAVVSPNARVTRSRKSLGMGSAQLHATAPAISSPLARPAANLSRAGSSSRQRVLSSDIPVETASSTPISTPVHTPVSSPVSTPRRSVFTRTTPGARVSGSPGGVNHYNRSTITAVRRGAILLQLVQEHKIMETGHLLNKSYSALAAEQWDSPGTPIHATDNKTLLRTALALESNGHLKVYKVSLPQMNGGTSERTLLLDASLNPEDQNVQRYIQEMKDRYTFNFVPGGRQRVPAVMEVEVERLSDMQERLLGKSSQASAEPNTEPDIYRGEEKESSSQPVRTVGKKKREGWAEIAQQYGFVTAVMLRARILHEWLFALLLDTKKASERSNFSVSAGPYRNGGVFQVIMLYRELPFEMYLKLVGQIQKSSEVDEFMTLNGYGNVKLVDLPENVRKIVWGPKSRVKRYLNQLLEILEALQILKPLPRNHDLDNNVPPIGDARATSLNFPARHVAVAYTLRPLVPLYDYVVDPSKLLHLYQLKTSETLQMFWFQFEFSCLRRNGTSATVEDVSEASKMMTSVVYSEEQIKALEKFRRTDEPGYLFKANSPLAMLQSARNWHTTFPYTKAQRDILESHIDREVGTTPLRNEALCREIANETSLTITRVKYYFSRSEDVQFHKLCAKQKLVKQRKANARVRREAGVGKRATGVVRLGRRTTKPPGTPKPTKPIGAGRRSRKAFRAHQEALLKDARNEALAGDVADDTLPVIASADRFLSQYHLPGKRVKAVWTPEDDSALLHAFAILKHGNQHKISWTPLGALFEGKDFHAREDILTRELCRRRMNVLSKTAAQKNLIMNLSVQWPIVRAKGIAENAFTKEEAYLSTPEDLWRLVAYFQKSSSPIAVETASALAPDFPLPNNLEQLHSCFTVHEGPTVPQLALVEDSIRSKMTVLYARPLTLCMSDEGLIDCPSLPVPDPEQLQMEVVKMIIKIILLTPEERYDPSRAFWILQTLPQNLVTNALAQLRSENVIVRKGAGDRRVPGRGFVHSDKFLSTIQGTLPDRLLMQARRYQAHLDEQFQISGEVEFSPFSNSGSMAVLVDGAASRKVRLVLKLNPSILETSSFDIFHDASKGGLGVSISQARSPPVTSMELDADESSEQAISIDPMGKWTHYPRSAADLTRAPLENEEDRPWLTKIYHFVKKSGFMGVTLPVLQAKFCALGVDVKTLNRYLNLFATTFRVRTKAAPLICAVGFNELRYITSTHYAKWAVPVLPAAISPSTLGPTAYNTSVEAFMPARMWFDIHGDPIESVRRGCMEAVLAYVVQKPGIYESKLQDRFSCVMTRLELREVTGALVSMGALRCKTFIKMAPIVNLFEELFAPASPSVLEADENSYEDRKITCYWPEADWYIKTSVK
ncbi:hypothetical protein HKX48_007757 [Thoreauomyces humboldtii]|nr:hypothetical protein HKX48_007757 [Thoreauomyces humboldtii]